METALLPLMPAKRRGELAPDERLRLLKAVADPTRLAVLDRLSSCGDRCHCDLEDDLGIATSRLSFHLKVLREAGLIEPSRQGRRVLYQLTPGAMDALRAALPVASSCCSPATEPAATDR